MKIAILSDTHDNIPNLKKTLSFLKKEGIKIIIHCGDVCQSETIKELEENFNSEIYLAFGNADLKEKIKNDVFKKTKFFDDYGKIEIGGLKIAFCHDPLLAKELYQTKKYDFVFHGHTHQPFLNREVDCFLANPGNLAGAFYKASFAILDTEKKSLELKILDNLSIA